MGDERRRIGEAKVTELETLLRNILDAEAELSQARENWIRSRSVAPSIIRRLAHEITVADRGYQTAISDAKEFLGMKVDS
jgi:hypothetical protein